MTKRGSRDLKDRVTLQRRGQDANGEPNGPWSTVASEAGDQAWAAKIIHLKGGEPVMAQRLQGVRPAVIVVRACGLTREADNSWRAIDRRDGQIYELTDARARAATGRKLVDRGGQDLRAERAAQVAVGAVQVLGRRRHVPTDDFVLLAVLDLQLGLGLCQRDDVRRRGDDGDVHGLGPGLFGQVLFHGLNPGQGRVVEVDPVAVRRQGAARLVSESRVNRRGGFGHL